MVRRHQLQTSQLDLLLRAGAKLGRPPGVTLETVLGTVQIDVLEVTDADLDPMPDDPTARLYAMSHTWAVESASLVRLDADHEQSVEVLVATPPALVAMKLQSSMDRTAAKAGTDLLDISRLVLDPSARAGMRLAFASTSAQLRSDCRLHANRWFLVDAAATLRKMRAVPEGRAETLKRATSRVSAKSSLKSVGARGRSAA